MKLRYIPNILTSIRLLLVVPVLLAILSEHYTLAFTLFLLSGLTDAFDGLLARVYNWTSRFGAAADPLADKLLLMTSFIALGWVKQIPLWLVAIVIARDVWIVCGGIAYRLVIGRLDFLPSMISKINTFLQILLITLMLGDLGVVQLWPWLLHSLMLAVLITTVASMLHYTWVWGQRAIANYPAKVENQT